MNVTETKRTKLADAFGITLYAVYEVDTYFHQNYREGYVYNESKYELTHFEFWYDGACDKLPADTSKAKLNEIAEKFYLGELPKRIKRNFTKKYRDYL